MSTIPNPLTGQNAQNPLGWPGMTGTNMPPSTSGAPSVPGSPSMLGIPTGPVAGPPQGQWGNPGNLENPGSNIKDQARNAGYLNVQQGQLRNNLIPQFASAMFGLSGPAAEFFKQLMNLGSPYYKEQQRASFEQDTQQAQNTAAGSKDRLNAAGYGAAPSGLEAATIGLEAQGESQNLSQTFLQNLFQNENLQMQASQAMAQMAQMFNPSQLFGATPNPGSTQGPTAASQFKDIMGGLFGGGGATGGASDIKTMSGH